jgi:predicted Holliday junction resolvase-like endonuclease
VTAFLEYLRAAQGIYGCCPNPQCRSHASLTERVLPLSRLRLEFGQASVRDRVAQLRDEGDEIAERKAQLPAERKRVRMETADRAREEVAKSIPKTVSLYGQLKLRPHEVRLVCHPIDVIAFPGYPDKRHRLAADYAAMDRIRLLDRRVSGGTTLHDSVRLAIEDKRYRWLTLWFAPPGNSSRRESEELKIVRAEQGSS